MNSVVGAESTLGDIQLSPRNLRRIFAGGMQSLDRGDRPPFQGGHASLAGAGRLPIDMHGAGTTLRDAAAILGARQRQLVAQEPEEGHGRIAVEAATCAVHGQGDHGVGIRKGQRIVARQVCAFPLPWASGNRARYAKRLSPSYGGPYFPLAAC